MVKGEIGDGNARGVSNDLKFRRSALKLFLKDERWPEI